VIDNFGAGDDAIVFAIRLHPGDVVADIRRYSVSPRESEMLIAASSAFRVLKVENIEVPISNVPDSPVRVIPTVTLNYEMSWSEFDIDNPPPPLLI
jgi:hypothetical protein